MRSIVDCIAFSKGVGLTVVFDDVVSPEGVVKPIIALNPALERLATTFKVPPAQELEVYRIVIQDPALFAGLNDRIVAITLPRPNSHKLRQGDGRIA